MGTDLPEGGAVEDSQSSAQAADGSKPVFKCQWNEEMHKGFLAAIFDLGLLYAKPTDILRVWSSAPAGIHKDHIKSHLQKYRRNAKRTREAFKSQLEASIDEALRENKRRALTPHLHAYPICAAKDKRVGLDDMDESHEEPKTEQDSQSAQRTHAASPAIPQGEAGAGHRQAMVTKAEHSRAGLPRRSSLGHSHGYICFHPPNSELCHASHGSDGAGSDPSELYNGTVISEHHIACATRDGCGYERPHEQHLAGLSGAGVGAAHIFSPHAHLHASSSVTNSCSVNACTLPATTMQLGAFGHDTNPSVEPSLCPFGSDLSGDGEEDEEADLFSFLTSMVPDESRAAVKSPPAHG